jgi:hypothetical protein
MERGRTEHQEDDEGAETLKRYYRERGYGP